MTFREYLQAELVKRCKENPRYSLRAFARSLHTDSSRLSKILKGDRPTNEAYIEKTGALLELPLEKIESFKANQTKKISIDKQQLKKQKDALQLTLETFEVISDWQHFAILDLIQVKNFTPTAKWISQSLEISIYETNACLQRLQKVGLLNINENGEFEDISNGINSFGLAKNKTTQAHKNHQRQLLEKSIEALRDIDVHYRDHSSRMIPTSYKKILEAKDMIKEFRAQLAAFLSDVDEKDTVYQLAVSLFPLSNKTYLQTKPKNLKTDNNGEEQ